MLEGSVDARDRTTGSDCAEHFFVVREPSTELEWDSEHELHIAITPTAGVYLGAWGEQVDSDPNHKDVYYRFFTK